MKAIYNDTPRKFEKIGEDRYLYNFNVTEVQRRTMTEGKTRPMYQCDQVKIWLPFDANKVTEAVISHLWDSNYEQKMINEYNTAMFGMFDEQTKQEKIDKYKEFLTKRQAVKEQIDTDFAEFAGKARTINR